MTTEPTPPTCAGCGHAPHAPTAECETPVHHGPSRMHLCLCLNRPGAALACPPQMTCQGGTLGYADVWYIQQGRRLLDENGSIHPAALSVEPRGPRATTKTTDLRQRIADTLTAAVVLPGAVPDDEEQVVLDDLTDALLPLFAAEREAEAHPPVHRWRVEHFDGIAEQWVPASGLKTNHEEALAQLRAGERNRPTWADGTPVQRRLVRETTTYTVEHARADAEDGGQ